MKPVKFVTADVLMAVLKCTMEEHERRGGRKPIWTRDGEVYPVSVKQWSYMIRKANATAVKAERAKNTFHKKNDR